MRAARRAGKRRTSRETDVRVRLDLDGDGRASVRLDKAAFLVHMLESFARFAKFDLDVTGRGDFDHHLAEDVAIALGRAFREALRDRPIHRVGSATLPMDDALVCAAVDVIDRPYVDLDLPDPMCAHVLRSFAHEAGINLHVAVLRGRDPHHICEAAFKAAGTALHQATRPERALKSTKKRVLWRNA